MSEKRSGTGAAIVVDSPRVDGERDDTLTLVAVGLLVAVVGSLAHEALGHGLGCYADHGSITLITFLVFRCRGAGVLADGGGPIGAFAVAVSALILFRALKPKVSVLRLFLLTFGLIVLFWFAAQMVREGIDGSDDWGHVARGLGWPPAWKVAAIVVGVSIYAATMEIAARLAGPFAAGRPLRLAIPWASTCVGAVVLGALWHGDSLASAIDGFMTFGLAPLGTCGRSWWPVALLLQPVGRPSSGISPGSQPAS